MLSTHTEQLAGGVSVAGLDESWRDVPAICATESGVGEDNPTDPDSLTPGQKRQAVVLQLEHVSSFHLVLSIDACCTTGRNFM